MSYLKRCELKGERRFTVTGIGTGKAFSVQWRSVSGTVTVVEAAPASGNTGYVAYYSRHSRLGGLLLRNAESERRYIAEAIRAALGEPESVTVSFTAI